jgi:hypothetical protein
LAIVDEGGGLQLFNTLLRFDNSGFTLEVFFRTFESHQNLSRPLLDDPGDASAVQCKLCSSSGDMAEAAAATASGGGGSLVWGWFHTSNAMHL